MLAHIEESSIQISAGRQYVDTLLEAQLIVSLHDAFSLRQVTYQSIHATFSLTMIK